MQNDDSTKSFVRLTKGTEVGQYRIIEKIGAGGMGEVFLAHDSKLDRQVALKFLSFHLSKDEISRARFTREARAAAKLDHPNIVPVYEVGEYSGRPFFAMAYIKGQLLREIIKQGKLTVQGAIEHCMQICEGLNEAHNAGIVHRDIKPGNIIIDTKNKPRILDFGLATVAGEEKLTKTGSTLGTVGYMSPEQVRGDKVDHRSDLFSIGVVFYELLSGLNPFKADSEAATTHAITQINPKPLARFNRDVPEELQRIIDKALTKDVSLRYQHADGMISDLKRLKTAAMQPTASKIGLWIAASVVVLAAGYFVYDQYFQTDSVTEEGWSNSIAVLPLRDFSPGKDQEFFSDGMTDAIISKLSGIVNLKVISMTSVMRYKEEERDLKKIGHDLQVEHILEGSVQLEGNRIRVRTQLINVADDAHLWSETYDRQLESIFEIQDDISQALVDAMRLELRDKGTKSIFGRHTKNVDAFNSYIKGRFHWNKRTEADIRLAIEHFEKAIELDPNYALAYSGLADAWSIISDYINVPDSIFSYASIEKARVSANIAIELDEYLAEAHASLGLTFHQEYEDESAEVELLRAIELNPGYHWAHFWYSESLEAMGRYQDQVKEQEIAYQLNPMSIPLINSRAYTKQWALEFDEAEVLYRRIIEIEPKRIEAYSNLCDLLMIAGRNDEAISLCEIATEIDVYAFNTLAYLHSRIGNFDKALLANNKYLMMGKDKHNALDSRADIFAGNGELDSALAYFSKALELEPDYVPSILNIGHINMFLGNYVKAESLYTIVASHSDKFWRAGGNLGLARMPLYQGKFKLALERLDKWEELVLSGSINIFNLGLGKLMRANTFQYALGMQDSAIAELNETIELIRDNDPNNTYFHSCLAGIGYSFAKLGDFEKADQFGRELDSLLYNYGPAFISMLWLYYGRLDLEKGNFDSAVVKLERVALLTTHHLHMQILAQGYFRSGRISDAITLYEKLTSSYDPWNRSMYPAWSVLAHYELGMAYQAASRYDDAIKQYEIFLHIWRNADEGLRQVEDAKDRLANLKAGK